MASRVFPTNAEVDRIVLGPESLVWQRFDDVRLFMASGFALLLQVAHPTVGSGVRDHSNFTEEPWDRLLRTVDYLFLLVYSGHEAVEMGRRLRALHRSIKGTNPDGSSYHALEPEAYAWVHATLIEGALAAHVRFVGPLKTGEPERFYDEYLPLGRLIGVREGDLPERWADFRGYVDAMIAERLERTESVDTVLATLASPAPPPPLPPSVSRLWPLLRVPPAVALRLATIGLLPPVLRRRFGVRWTRRDAVGLRAMGAAARAVGPLLPRTLRHSGPPYLEWRAAAIRRGPLGPGPGEAVSEPAPSGQGPRKASARSAPTARAA